MNKKILQISPYDFEHIGWVEQYAKILQEIFWEEIITISWWKDFPIIEPVKHCPLPCFWNKNLYALLNKFNKNNTRVIVSHIRFAPTAWLAFLYAKVRNIPYIHIEHGAWHLVHKNPFIALVAKIVDITIWKYIIRNASYVICVSEYSKNWVKETFWKDIPISVIYMGFSFPSIQRTPNAIKKIWFVWRLTWLKNIEWLLVSLSQIKKIDWLCKIVWDGEEKSRLISKSKELGLSERIEFIWAKENKWILTTFYPSIDIFVSPSLQEWLWLSIIEAVWMWCDVIATSVGGCTEIPWPLFTWTSTDELSKGISYLLENKVPKNDALREEFDEKFSIKNMKRNFIDIFSRYN